MSDNEIPDTSEISIPSSVEQAPAGRVVLTVENMTDTELGFVLCRKRDDCLHLHIVDPEDADEIHGVKVRTFDPPDMRTFMADAIVEVDR